MQAVILMHEFNTSASTEMPPSMIRMHARPVVWHIMKHYSRYGIHDFILCAHHAIDIIKDYFINYATYTSNITIDLEEGISYPHEQKQEPWKITIIDIGENTQSGGALLHVAEHLEETFFLTYGHILSNINLHQLLIQHQTSQTLCTGTLVQPTVTDHFFQYNENNLVLRRTHQTQKHTARILAGCYILEPKALQYITHPVQMFEEQPIDTLIQHQQFSAYLHDDLWIRLQTQQNKHEAEHIITQTSSSIHNHHAIKFARKSSIGAAS